MMKKFLFFISIIYLSITSVALAFPNEPTGFRGLEWGSSIEEFKQKYPNAYEVEIRLKKEREELFGNTGNIAYCVPSENDFLSQVSIAAPIKYHFWNNQLEDVSIDISGDSLLSTTNNEQRLLAALETLYGECTTKYVDGSIVTNDGQFTNMYFWEGATTSLFLLSNYRDQHKHQSSLSLSIASQEIRNKRIKQSKLNMQEKAKQGW